MIHCCRIQRRDPRLRTARRIRYTETPKTSAGRDLFLTAILSKNRASGEMCILASYELSYVPRHRSSLELLPSTLTPRAWK